MSVGQDNPVPTRSLSGRVLDVLGAFRADCPELTLSQISRRSGLPLTTTHRIVGELAARGMLERGADGKYRIGLRLWEIASLAPRGLRLREIALPCMEDLCQATHENVQLAVREGTELVFIERLAGHRAVPVLTRVGGRFALHATGVGLVLLAYSPPEIQEQVLDGPLESWTPRTITSPVQLRRILADVRQRGYSLSDRQVTMDSLSVGAPIRAAGDEVIAALSIVVHYDGSEPRTLGAAVRAAARGISRSLGAPSASLGAGPAHSDGHGRPPVTSRGQP